MKRAEHAIAIICCLFALVAATALSAAAQPISSDVNNNHAGRYGPIGLLDHRSIYDQYWFPEPLRADEADVDNELRLDGFHVEKRGHNDNKLKLEVEKSLGLFTFEVAPTWESHRSATFNPLIGRTERGGEQGLGNVELGARLSVFQYVSPDRLFDTTFVFGMEATVPTRTKISKDWELVPKVFNLSRIGEHFSVQLGLGDSIIVGPAEHGLSTLEYSIVLGYELTRKDLPLPGVTSVVPLLEFQGQRILNQADRADNALLGTVGCRLNLEAVAGLPAQPRLGLGYVFPIDKGARDELRWGIVASLVFEY